MAAVMADFFGAGEQGGFQMVNSMNPAIRGGFCAWQEVR